MGFRPKLLFLFNQPNNAFFLNCRVFVWLQLLIVSLFAIAKNPTHFFYFYFWPLVLERRLLCRIIAACLSAGRFVFYSPVCWNLFYSAFSVLFLVDLSTFLESTYCRTIQSVHFESVLVRWPRGILFRHSRMRFCKCATKCVGCFNSFL